jgi:hypothetical protein
MQGTCEAGYDGDAFRHLGNGVNYFYGSLDFGFTGLETYITASLRGFTIGGWFMFDATPAASGGMIGQDQIAPQRGYSLRYSSGGSVVFGMSGTGGAQFFATSQALALGAWHFCVGRFIPSTEVAVFANGDKTANTTAIPSSCFVSAGRFEIGRQVQTDANILHGKVRDAFMCRAALSDELIEQIRLSSVPSS